MNPENETFSLNDLLVHDAAERHGMPVDAFVEYCVLFMMVLLFYANGESGPLRIDPSVQLELLRKTHRMRKACRRLSEEQKQMVEELAPTFVDLDFFNIKKRSDSYE